MTKAPTPKNSAVEIVEARFAAAAMQVSELPPPTNLEIAFAGRSNVGKSSLLNGIMQRRNLARTSSTPGCTRKITFYEVRSRDGTTWTLADLPGYGYAARSKTELASWAELIESYLLERSALAAVAVLADARRGLEPDEHRLFELLTGPRPSARALHTIVVGTKLDKVPRGERPAALRAMSAPDRPAVGFSTELPETASLVWERLTAKLR